VRAWKAALLLVIGLGLGLFPAIFLGNSRAGKAEAELLREIERQEGRQRLLREEEGRLERWLELAEQEAAAETDLSAALRAREQEAEEAAGMRGLTGPGLELELDDAPRERIPAGIDYAYFMVHDRDLLYIVNELRAAGAKAIAINGERLTATSPIICRGPTIYIARNSFAPPYVVSVLGEQEALLRAAREAIPRFMGISYTIRVQEALFMPSARGFRPVAEGPGGRAAE
jgi:uncharacterized protein YlxW (UPF0749 family)